MNTPPKRKRAPGGGRKPIAPGGLLKVTVRLSASDLEYLRTLDPNIAAAIRKLISAQTLPVK